MKHNLAASALLIILAGFSGCVGDVPASEPPATTAAPTTSTSSTTTTAAPTTSTAPPTTTSSTVEPYRVDCRMNADCGEAADERICNEGNVYVNRVSPACQNPGTPYAKCVNRTALSRSPAEVCSTRTCVDGECVHV
jgi:hypothetical protein